VVGDGSQEGGAGSEGGEVGRQQVGRARDAAQRGEKASMDAGPVKTARTEVDPNLRTMEAGSQGGARVFFCVSYNQINLAVSSLSPHRAVVDRENDVEASREGETRKLGTELWTASRDITLRPSRGHGRTLQGSGSRAPGERARRCRRSGSDGCRLSPPRRLRTHGGRPPRTSPSATAARRTRCRGGAGDQRWIACSSAAARGA